MLRGSGNKVYTLESGGQVYYNFIRGADLNKVFTALIRDNNGCYKSMEHAAYIEAFMNEHGTAFSAEVGEADLEELDLVPLQYQKMVIIGGRYTPPKVEKQVPICSVYVIDYAGVVEKYKCRFTCNTRHRCIKDYELADVNLIWKRKKEEKYYERYSSSAK